MCGKVSAGFTNVTGITTSTNTFMIGQSSQQSICQVSQSWSSNFSPKTILLLVTKPGNTTEEVIYLIIQTQISQNLNVILKIFNAILWVLKRSFQLSHKIAFKFFTSLALIVFITFFEAPAAYAPLGLELQGYTTTPRTVLDYGALEPAIIGKAGENCFNKTL